MDLHLNAQFLQGTRVLKVKRDFFDGYVWVLAKNNEVYRVNSVSKTVDNYSAQFAAYSGDQFIDIAGRSQDTMFIATKGSLIIFEKGNISVKTVSDGLLGNTQSIGIGYHDFLQTKSPLLIGTDNGLNVYDYFNNQLSSYPETKDTRIFEATYRREMYSNFGITSLTSPNLFPVAFYDDITTFGSYLFRTGIYGDNIRAAFYTTATLYPSTWGESYNLFWATEKGLYQVDDATGSGGVPYQHYLDGVQINKITDICGLASFGNFNTRENLLIGTDQGLYFTNSVYWGIATDALLSPAFYYDSEIGNVGINDICVNPASTKAPICEDGVWLATNNGLYLIKPDYASTTQSVDAVHFDNQLPTVSELDVCADNTLTAVINGDVQVTNIQWYKDGQELPAESNPQLKITSSGDYYAVLYDPCGGSHLESNHLKANFIQPPVYTFNYPDKLAYCTGTPVTLKATGSSAYRYRWYLNGALDGNVRATENVIQSGKYKVEVSSCEDSWVPSKEVQVDLITIPAPTLKADKASYCIGDQATLTISVAPDPTYTINWYKDNVQLDSYINQTSLNTNISGNYVIAITSNEANTDGSVCTQTSMAQNITFNPLPTVGIQKIVKTTLCDGQTVELKVSYNNGTVGWSTGQNSDQITVSASGNYKATVTSTAGCISDASINVQFFPNPILNLPNPGVCVQAHKTATITAPSGMTSYVWNGQPGAQTYIADHPQMVTLTITDANGCQATQGIQVADECPDTVIPNAFTPNGDGINDTWDIKGLEYDPTALVRIFTRYGQQIYESKGYTKPWDGTDRGKQLPSGTYYYIINVKNNTQTYSGWVTIIY